MRIEEIYRYKNWAHSRWNGEGEDVMDEAIILGIKRGYEDINFSLLKLLCLEAARNMGIFTPAKKETINVTQEVTIKKGVKIKNYEMIIPPPDTPPDTIELEPLLQKGWEPRAPEPEEEDELGDAFYNPIPQTVEDKGVKGLPLFQKVA